MRSFVRLRGNHGKPVFQTDQITDTLQGKAGQPEVFELPGGINGCGIENDMIMHMGSIRVRCHDKSTLSLGKPKGPAHAPIGLLPPV